jgi:hypothetical protein
MPATGAKKKVHSLHHLGVEHPPQIYLMLCEKWCKKKVWGWALDTPGDWAKGGVHTYTYIHKM